MSEEAEPGPARLSLRRLLPSRKRLTELAVVVFGVLIALGLENMVQEWRWRQEGRELEALARQELEVNLAEAIERIAVDPCLRERVAFLASGLGSGAVAYAPQPFTIQETTRAKRSLVRPYQPLPRPWRSASLERLLAAEASKRISASTLLEYSRALAVLESLRRDQADELAAAGRLLPLAVGVPQLNEEVRVSLLADLGDLERARAGLELISQRLVDRAAVMRIAPYEAEIQRRLNDLRAVWGDCVDVTGGLAVSNRLTALNT